MNNLDELSPPPHHPEPDAPLSPMEGPMPAAGEHSAKHTRRIFLFKLSIALNGLVGAALAVPILGYVLAPMFRRDASYNSWIPLMAVDAIPVGATRLVEFLNPVRTPTDGETAKIPCWARREGPQSYVVFAINCAHLGCPVRWFEQSQLFLCPCHGGTYYANGERASGPPPRGLFKYAIRLQNNQVWIDAGEMPTLADHACLQKRDRSLIQIEPSAPQTEAVNLLPRRDAGTRGRNA